MYLLLCLLFLLRAQNHTSFYSEYCADSVENNVIAGLTEAQLTFVDSLEQVQILFRHGARVAATEGCYNIEVEPVWNCSDTSTLFIPLVKSDIQDWSASDDPLIFHKVFQTDALVQDNTHPGDCLNGQLLVKGAEQEWQNGKNLRDRFIGDDRQIHLWSNSSIPKLSSPEIYLYSTNVQRTQASLYYLLLGLLETQGLGLGEIAVHTRDREQDHFSIGHGPCDAFDVLEDSIWESIQKNVSSTPEYISFTQEYLANFGKPFSRYETDCALANFCAGNEMPDQLSDPSEQFFIDATSYGLEMQVEYFSNEMANQPFAAKMLQDMKYKFDLLTGKGYPKFVAWSAHDSTLLAFLNGMGMVDEKGGPFPVYATLLTIETYLLTNGTYGVRVTRNGRPITSLMPECEEDICDADVFFTKLVDDGWGYDCGVNTTDHEDISTNKSTEVAPVWSRSGAYRLSTFAIVALMIASFFLGALIVHCRHRIIRKRQYSQLNNGGDVEYKLDRNGESAGL